VAAGLKEEKKRPGEAILRPIQICLGDAESEKIWSTRQANSLEARIANSNSINAVSFSSARATKRFPSPRRA
jgi:hypothetical protein